MTGCIAAICVWTGSNMIIGASDRMVTFGDVEYEQPHPKILRLASHTVALTSGPSNHHAANCHQLLEKAREHDRSDS
jgi:hypothetical protein